MSLKERMMERMMKKMSKEEKQEMMNTMMDNFFGDMTAEDKREMMSEMMPRMMGDEMNMMEMMMGMMGGGRNHGGHGHGQEKKSGRGKDQRHGHEGHFNMMDMCRQMMGHMGQPASKDDFATPELRTLFQEWVSQIGEELEKYIDGNESASVQDLARQFKLGEDSINFLLTENNLASRVKADPDS